MSANTLPLPRVVSVICRLIRPLPGPVLGRPPPHQRVKVDDILSVVSRHYGITRQDILSQRRHRSVVLARQIGMYLSRHLTSRGLPEIGRRFGDRDHTTVLHAIGKIDRMMTENPEF